MWKTLIYVINNDQSITNTSLNDSFVVFLFIVMSQNKPKHKRKFKYTPPKNRMMEEAFKKAVEATDSNKGILPYCRKKLKITWVLNIETISFSVNKAKVDQSFSMAE